MGSETKFSHTEVVEFRELFVATGMGKEELGFEDVKKLLECIVPMGAKNVEQLQKEYLTLAVRQEGVMGEEELLDFPEFLWLMRALLDTNFANMTDRAGALVASSAPPS